MLAAVGVRLELDGDPGVRATSTRRLNEHPPAFISKWFWPEPVDAIVGFIATWGQDGGPNFQRSSDERARPRLPRLGARAATTSSSAPPRATSSCAPPSACR